MKKLVAIILCAVLAVHTAAMTTGSSTYEYETAESHVSVTFSEDSSFVSNSSNKSSRFFFLCGEKASHC